MGTIPGGAVTQATLEQPTDWHDPPGKRRAGWFAVLLIVALAVTLAGVFPFRQILAQDRQVEMAQEKLDALVAENARLRDEIDILQSPSEIERLAREDLGLVYPGETGYAVRTPPADESEPEPVPGGLGDHRSILEKIWDFLTGRDLVANG